MSTTADKDTQGAKGTGQRDDEMRYPITPDDLAELLDDALVEIGRERLLRCPAHDDGDPSLVILDGTTGSRKGRLNVHCRGGCTHDAVVAALAARNISLQQFGLDDYQSAGSKPNPGTAKPTPGAGDDDGESDDDDDGEGGDDAGDDGDGDAGETTGKAGAGNKAKAKGSAASKQGAAPGHGPETETLTRRAQRLQCDRLWELGSAIQGTPAEQYFRQQRSLPTSERWNRLVCHDGVLRYSVGGPLKTSIGEAIGACALARITADRGMTSGYQIWLLSQDGQKQGKRYIVGRATPGACFVRFQYRIPGHDYQDKPTLILSEGNETGLSRLALEDEYSVPNAELRVTLGPLPDRVGKWMARIAKVRAEKGPGAPDYREVWSRIELAIDRDKVADCLQLAWLVNAATRLPVVNLVVPAHIMPRARTVDLNDVWRLRTPDGLWSGPMELLALVERAKAAAVQPGEAVMGIEEDDLADEIVQVSWRGPGGERRMLKTGAACYRWNPEGQPPAWQEIHGQTMRQAIRAITRRSYKLNRGGLEGELTGRNQLLLVRLANAVGDELFEPDIMRPSMLHRLRVPRGASPLPDWIALATGQMLQLETRDLQPLDPTIFALSHIAADPMELTVVPVRFEQMLRDAFSTVDGFDEADVEAQILKAYEIIGHALSGGALNLQKFVLLFGGGGTGKGVFEEVLKALLGDGLVSTNVQDLCNVHGMTGLLGARVILLPESRSLARNGPGGGETALEVLLRITGGNDVLVNPKFLQTFNARLTQCVLLTSNNVPRALVDPAGASRRRLEVLSFGQRPADRVPDPELVQKIIGEGELSGILGRALDGLDRLRKTKTFTTSHGMQRQHLSTLGQIEILRGFVVYLEPRKPTDYLTRDELYDGYRAWAQLEGVRERDLWRRQTFINHLRTTLDAMPERGIRLSIERNRRRMDGQEVLVWEGLGWVEGTPEPIRRGTSQHRAVLKDLDDALRDISAQVVQLFPEDKPQVVRSRGASEEPDVGTAPQA